jgi:hypothetical protein
MRQENHDFKANLGYIATHDLKNKAQLKCSGQFSLRYSICPWIMRMVVVKIVLFFFTIHSKPCQPAHGYRVLQ